MSSFTDQIRAQSDPRFVCKLHGNCSTNQRPGNCRNSAECNHKSIRPGEVHNESSWHSGKTACMQLFQHHSNKQRNASCIMFRKELKISQNYVHIFSVKVSSTFVIDELQAVVCQDVTHHEAQFLFHSTGH